MELLNRYFRCLIGTVGDLENYICEISNQVFVNEFDGDILSLYTCFKMQDVIRRKLEEQLMPLLPRGVEIVVECSPNTKMQSVNIQWYFTLNNEVADPEDIIRRIK